MNFFLRRFFLFLLLLPAAAGAQNKYTVSGNVKNKKSGESIIGAIIRIPEVKGAGAASNEYGFFSITVPEGDYTLTVSMTGYKPQSIPLSLHQNVHQDFMLEDTSFTQKEVVITGDRKDQNVTDPQMGAQKLDMKEVNKIPVLFGEKDVLKTIQLLPGIKSGGDGGSGFFVRGGAADQNLILLDEAPVYNASHLLGFFSTFNSDAIKDVTVYKGNAPAQYGGRLASVLDVKMNDGNNQHYHVSGGLGLISSKLNVEGPIVKNKGSFLITGRRTYADLFLKLSNNETTKNSQLYFYDLNLKANYELNDRNRIFLSGYFGRDKIGLANTFGIDWGNATGTFRWNHVTNERLFSNTSLIFSNYSYKISISGSTATFDITSKIRDYNLKHEYQFFPNPKNSIRFGFNSIYHTVTPGQITAEAGSSINPVKLQDRYGWENAVFISNEWKATERISITYGLRGSSFSILGKGDFYSFDTEGNVSDTAHYSSGQIVKTYFNLEPRISGAVLINEKSSVKFSYSRNTQYLHLLSNSTSTSPTDLWIMSSPIIRPELCDQYALGYYRNFRDNTIECSAEIYYKTMQHQIDYKNGANTQGNDLVEGELLFGIGRAYGLELFAKKNYGKFTGWVSYTLSKSERQIAGINDGNWYPVKQDRTHDVSIVLMYDLTPKWSIAATWVYNTGDAVTFPSGKYYVDGQVQFYYTERNGYRMPAYHRMDIGATWQRKKTDKFESSWNFSVYNVYARENAYVITFRQDPNDASKTQAVQTSLFRLVPSVTYNFRF
ncbi:MAG TPA: TonB-dependent receptor [Bacteroidia bacterium]|nr:TonB-dependent receptor [Bacteroidia bacterium]